MRIGEAIELIKKKTPGSKVGFKLYESGDFIDHEEYFGVAVAYVHSFNIVMKGRHYTFDMAPLLNADVQAEWLERMVYMVVYEKIVPYREYVVQHNFPSYGFNIHLADGLVRYYHEDGVGVEEWFPISDNELDGTYYRMLETGIEYRDIRESRLYEDMVTIGDLHYHPGNVHLHHLGFLLPAVPNAYIGSKIYYVPGEASILLKCDREWIWCHAKSVFRRMPKPYANEISALKNFYDL